MKTEPTTGVCPLSPMQQGMLFHNLSARGPGVDVEQIYCTLREKFSAPAFERAWRRVIERHAILRTSFHWQGLAEPLQKVHAQVAFSLPQHDWRNHSSAEQQKLFAAQMQTERQRGFDLTHAAAMRIALFQNGENEWRFLWTFHHLLLDGRAIVVLLNEVFACYEAFSRGEDLELPPPRPFRDFIEWLQKKELNGAEIYWRQTLKGFSTSTPLTVSHAAPGEAGRGQIHGEPPIRVSAATTTALKSIGAENKLTLNTFLQGAWALLLSRYSGSEDVVFGAVRAGRHSTVEAAESIVGLFINTVPVRVPVSADEKLLPWLARLRNTWVALREFEHTPLVKIQSWSEIPSRPAVVREPF